MLDYARLPRWQWPFAPHDLGTYPQANGQVYGGGERTEENQMPVEESGNMLILLAALAQVEGNADFAEKYWPQLTKWAEYLKEKGPGPGEPALHRRLRRPPGAQREPVDQGHPGAGRVRACLRHDRAQAPKSRHYRKTAQRVRRTSGSELAADGDHYRLAFDKPGTWSQKYNLVWDQLLGLNLFPPEVARHGDRVLPDEAKPYGLPLDNRRSTPSSIGYCGPRPWPKPLGFRAKSSRRPIPIR